MMLRKMPLTCLQAIAAMQNRLTTIMKKPCGQKVLAAWWQQT
jgi:hypothetical protein